MHGFDDLSGGSKGARSFMGFGEELPVSDSLRLGKGEADEDEDELDDGDSADELIILTC